VNDVVLALFDVGTPVGSAFLYVTYDNPVSRTVLLTIESFCSQWICLDCLILSLFDVPSR
jgi:hypothetical protein